MLSSKFLCAAKYALLVSANLLIGENFKMNHFIALIFLIASLLMAQNTIPEEDVKYSVKKFGDAFVKADVSILREMLCEN